MASAAALKTAISHTQPLIPAAEAGSLPAFAYAMLSHPGRVRHTNQDACAATPECAAFVVCDGVGGAAGGEIASQLAVDSFLNALRQSAPGIAGNGNQPNGTSPPHNRMHQAVHAANAAVFQRAQRTRSLRGMATTLVAALLEYQGAPRLDSETWDKTSPVPHSSGDVGPAADSADETVNGQRTFLWLAHAGDSRAYLLRRTAEGNRAELRQLTRDHSLVEEQVRAGILSPFDALRSPVRNVITRAVGSMPTVEPEIAAHEIQPGDLYLLASDGLTRELADAEIARILSEALVPDPDPPPGRTSARRTSQPALENAAQALIAAANQHGGRDNITVLLLACR